MKKEMQRGCRGLEMKCFNTSKAIIRKQSE